MIIKDNNIRFRGLSQHPHFIILAAINKKFTANSSQVITSTNNSITTPQRTQTQW
jgi:hypothetical protein